MKIDELDRRGFLALGVGSLVAAATLKMSAADAKTAPAGPAPASVRIALVQFDTVPERVQANLQQMARLTRQAAAGGAKWILFHENTTCDYTPRLDELAEAVPDGPSTRFVAALAKETGTTIGFGLSERDGDRFYITQVFVGPSGFIHRYRKTWLWYLPDSKAGEWVGGYRNEWDRYDAGAGPEPFLVDGVRATCFICADGNSARCLERARMTRPQVVFYPNNRSSLGDPAEYARRARVIGAPLLVANRVGRSWVRECDGGAILYDGQGAILARANHAGREEILIHDLKIPA